MLVSELEISLEIICTRGKILAQLPSEKYLQGFEISRAFLRAKQAEEKRGEIQNPVKIAHKAVVLIFLSLWYSSGICLLQINEF